jgi:hypothetical protein
MTTTLSCYSRNQYVQDRVAARMEQRGEPMILRSVSELSGPEPYRNPPDLSADLLVTAGSYFTPQAFIGITGTTVTGRLVPGDRIVVDATMAMPANPTTLVVMPMPANVMTDGDGIPITDVDGNPVFGTPAIYRADTLARGNAFPVVAVSGTTIPETLVGDAVMKTIYAADLTVFGWQMSREKMVALGWIELDSIGIEISGKGIPPPQPKVNDQIIFAGGSDLRAIMTVGVRAINGVSFLFQLQAR